MLKVSTAVPNCTAAHRTVFSVHIYTLFRSDRSTPRHTQPAQPDRSTAISPSPLLHTTTLPTVTLPTTYLLHLLKLYLAFEREKPLFSSLGACIFRTVTLHQRPLRTIYDTLSLTKSTLLTADTILWSTINPVPN